MNEESLCEHQAAALAEWCLYTGRSVEDFHRLTGYERRAFVRAASIYRERGASI